MNWQHICVKIHLKILYLENMLMNDLTMRQLALISWEFLFNFCFDFIIRKKKNNENAQQHKFYYLIKLYKGRNHVNNMVMNYAHKHV